METELHKGLFRKNISIIDLPLDLSTSLSVTPHTPHRLCKALAEAIQGYFMIRSLWIASPAARKDDGVMWAFG